jgi:hypothetical protein
VGGFQIGELISKLRKRLGQASPSTPETGVKMEGFACQNRSFEITSGIQLIANIAGLPGKHTGFSGSFCQLRGRYP